MAEDKPNRTVLGKIRDKFSDLLRKANENLRQKALQTFQTLSARVRGSPVVGNSLFDENRDRMTSRLYPKHIGRMMMFYYDPKLKKQLPYYDRFPLVIPIEFYPDGFLGLNLHYLPPGYRARLMDLLYNTIYTDKYLDERKIIRISYRILISVIKSNLYKPCVKRYLYGHIRSRFLILDPNDWQIALFLPTERFEKANLNVVYNDSIRKIRG